MRKYFIIFAALAACTFLSCQKEAEVIEEEVSLEDNTPAEESDIDAPSGEIIEFKAGFNSVDVETKTYITVPDDQHRYFPKWNSSDRIKVNGVVSTNTAGETRSEDFTSATFAVAGVTAPFFALAPNDDDRIWKKDEEGDYHYYEITVKGAGAPQKYRTYTDESSDNDGTNLTYDMSHAILAAYSETEELHFEQLCTYYKLNIAKGAGAGEDALIKSVTVKQNDGGNGYLAGKWTIKREDNDFVLAPSNCTNVIKLNCQKNGTADIDGVDFGKPVMLVLPSYDFENGLILTIEATDGNTKSYSIDGQLGSKRGRILTKNLTFTPKRRTINSASDWNEFAAMMNNAEHTEWDLARWIDPETNTATIGADIEATSLTQIVGPRGKFNYNIDGQNHTIKQTAATHSLIRNIRGTVSDLKLAGTLNATGMVSPLVDTLYAGGSITGVKNYMTIDGVQGSSACSTSGLVLIARGGTISGCENHGNITATVDCSSKSYNCQVGGIVCQINNLSENLLIEDCTNYGTLTVTPTITGTTYSVGYAGLGGIVGWVRSNACKVTLDNCDNEGALIWNKPDAAGNKCQTSVGGILGIAAPISTSTNIYVISVPTENNGMWIELKDCDNKGSVTCKALSNSSSTEARNKVYIGGIAGSLQGQSSKHAVIDNCQSTGTILGYDITSDDPYNDATASQRAGFSTVLGGISGWSAYIDVKNGTTVKCAIGSINRQVAAIGGAFGFTIRPFSISNSNIYYTGYFNRVPGFQSNRAVIAVVPVNYDKTAMSDKGGFTGPDVSGSSVTNCKYGAALHTNSSTFDYTTTTCLSESVTIFNDSSSASGNMVVGHGFTNNTGITTSDNTFWNGN